MTRASMPETKSAKPKSPPAPSSGAPPASEPPVSQVRSPSRRAMNPSTLMPRNTQPARREPSPDTVPEGYDDSDPRPNRRVRVVETDDRVTGPLEPVVRDVDDEAAG